MKAYVDANVLCLASCDLGQRGNQAKSILEKIQSGQVTGYTCSLAIDELMWVITKQKQGRELKNIITQVYAIPNFHVLDTPSHAPLKALEFMKEYNLKPRDAIHLTVMREQDIATIYSDDADFDRVKGIKRIF